MFLSFSVLKQGIIIIIAYYLCLTISDITEDLLLSFLFTSVEIVSGQLGKSKMDAAFDKGNRSLLEIK